LFHYGEAQSDVSKAFAQDAIEMHERMRAAAPDLLAALQEAQKAMEYIGKQDAYVVYDAARAAKLSVAAAIAKATGSAA
jgi:hypothetical protein